MALPKQLLGDLREGIEYWKQKQEALDGIKVSIWNHSVKFWDNWRLTNSKEFVKKKIMI